MNEGLPRVELGDVQDGELVLVHEAERLLKLLLRLARESSDDVGGQREPRDETQHLVRDGFEVSESVLSVHPNQHRVRSRLYRHVQEREDVGPPHSLGDALHVLQHVRWVCHPKAKHHSCRGRYQMPVKFRTPRPFISSGDFPNNWHLALRFSSRNVAPRVQMHIVHMSKCM